LSEPHPHAVSLGEPECPSRSVAFAAAHCGPAILFPSFAFSARFRSLFSVELESAISVSQFSLLPLGRFFGLFSSAKIGAIADSPSPEADSTGKRRIVALIAGMSGAVVVGLAADYRAIATPGVRASAALLRKIGKR
jgi:hypothetical protein